MKKWILWLSLCCIASATAQPTTADHGNGHYRNPVLYADYSDPDVIRTGKDYWMTASSFNCVPGLPILHSTDLVNWQIVGAALPRLYDPTFDAPSHGNGVWAPAIRFHDGWYYIYWGDPDRGIYMVRTQDPRGKWSQPLLVKAARGIIDTCPLWDDDGRAYLVHGWAGSRAGFKSMLSVSEMSADGCSIIGEEVLIFDGHQDHPTVEGPKFYKRNGYYYVFAPAGGVKTGWQLVLRSRAPFGPYECRKVLHQGKTATHGPHQGAWVEDTAGDSWFLHFVDEYAYGRVAHLQPMQWTEQDWCVIGSDSDGDGIGEPVDKFREPTCSEPVVRCMPAVDDNFDATTLGAQWQWPANPQSGWYFNDPSNSRLRLMCVPRTENWHNLADTPNLLLQKIAAPNYTFTAKVDFHPSYEGDRAGLVVMGDDYGVLGLCYSDGKIRLEQRLCRQAIRKGSAEQVADSCELASGSLWLRCIVRQQRTSEGVPQMICSFEYSLDGRRFTAFGASFEAQAGQWIGAKIGLYAESIIRKNDGGWFDVDWCRTSK